MKRNSDHWAAWEREFDRLSGKFQSFSTNQEPEASVESIGKIHTITASSWRKRVAFFRMFQRLAWKLLVTGKVTMKI